jgi:hypothetical protein
MISQPDPAFRWKCGSSWKPTKDTDQKGNDQYLPPVHVATLQANVREIYGIKTVSITWITPLDCVTLGIVIFPL